MIKFKHTSPLEKNKQQIMEKEHYHQLQLHLSLARARQITSEIQS